MLIRLKMREKCALLKAVSTEPIRTLNQAIRKTKEKICKALVLNSKKASSFFCEKNPTKNSP